jgi:death-on-curing protein
LRSEPLWLSADDLIGICIDVVAQTGENYALISPAGLQSALDRPFNYWYYGEDSIVVLAVKLLLGVGQNHPFEQGNKRTALISTALFLQDNGYRFVVDDAEFLGELVRAAIVGDRSERDFIAILRTFIAAV